MSQIKKISHFLLVILIVSLLIKYKLYSDLISIFIYDFTNPRQLQGVFNLIFYLGIIIQIIIIVLIGINYKKIKTPDFIIALFSLIFIISLIGY